jgi:nucleoid-associated protein YgaU
MGLFDFAKEIGSKLFSNDADAAAKITAHLEENNPGIEGVSVIFQDGKATVIGVANSMDAAQKAILIAGNVQGVEEVISKIDIPESEADSVAEPGGGAKMEAPSLESGNVEFYVIQKGDTLSKIAKKYYQNAMEYPRIFDANKEVIKDPDLIYPGQKIRIPLD